MKKKIIALAMAAIAVATGGCTSFPVEPPAVESSAVAVKKAQISVDSKTELTLRIGETYKLIYSSSYTVTVVCNGKFNYLTNVFTAEEAGEYEILLSAGSGEEYNEVKVVITVVEAGDKAPLIELMQQAESYVESDYYNFDSVRSELAFCEEIVANDYATQEEIDGALLGLQTVYGNLKPISYGNKKAVIDEEFLFYNEEYYYKKYYANFSSVAEAIKALNADGNITLYSEYEKAVKLELEKLERTSNNEELAEMNYQRGIQMAEKVFDGYYVERTALRGGNIVYDVLDGNGNHVKNQSTGNTETDFWSLTSFLALMVRLDTVSETSYKEQVDKVIEAMAYHRGARSDNKEKKEYHVYAVHRGRIKDRADVYGDHGEESVFDDQIWAAQEFLNAYRLYGEQSYLDVAIELVEYIYTVGNAEISGIYWGQAYQTRHACSNAPFIKLAAMLSETTKESKYLDWAKEIYAFTYGKLRDPSDNLYYDLIGTVYDENGVAIGDGSIDTKKYSYNSGSMISAGVALYKATGEQHYLDEAKATAYSARNYFGNTHVKEGYILYPGSDGGTTYSWFDLILFKGYYDLFTVDATAGQLLEEVQNTFDYNYDRYNRDGFIPTSGLNGWTDGRNSYEYRVLMDHVTNADVMLLLGQYQEGKN